MTHSLVALLAASVLLVACGPADPLAPRSDAHVILISIDTLRADRLGLYGHERPTSPTLDALAAESLVFDRFYANANSTGPSQMTMMTGVLPPVHGVRHRADVEPSQGLPLLAEILGEAGYRTAAFADGGFVIERLGFDRGFETFRSRYEPFERKLDDVEAWLDGADPAEPTFLFVHTYGVHAPYVPTLRHDVFSDPGYSGPLRSRVLAIDARLESDGDDHDLALLMEAFWDGRRDFDATDTQHLLDLYDGCIRRIDAGIARLLERLERDGWLDDAWVVVTSDHGEAFREHGTFEHRQLYDEEVHIPLIVRPPGGLAGRRHGEVASLVDLAPTILASVGLDVPASMQGRPRIAGARPDAERPVHMTSSDGEAHTALVDGEWKLIRRGLEAARRELYDRAGDPFEREDLLTAGDSASAERAASLAAKAEAIDADALRWRERVGEPVAAGALTTQDRETLEALGYLDDDDR